MKRVLVIDDDVDVVEEVKWLLNEEGYITGCVNLRNYQRVPANLILLDISTPDRDVEIYVRN